MEPIPAVQTAYESDGSPPTPLLARLAYWAARQPSKRLFAYLDDAGKEVAALSYGEVEERSRRIAVHLLSGSPQVRPGDRVLLVFLPCIEFIVAFLACLRVGVVAVPVYPPDPSRTKAHFGAFASIAAGCGARVALTHASYQKLLSLASLKDSATRILSGIFRKGDAASVSAPLSWPDLEWLPVDAWMAKGVGASAAAAVVLDAASPNTLAFLQYTSGSTSEPKGVMITHGNLAHNLHTIIRSLRAGDDTRVVSWLPQYHDMGLIGAYLGALYCGGSGVYFSPISFIKRPAMWMLAIAQYRATHVQTPNFGLRLAARKWDPEAAAAAGLDMSALRHIFNAAEPIVAAAIANFMDIFAARYSLPRSAMRPGYGLAEHCVFVSEGGTRVLHVDREALESRGDLEVCSSASVEGLGEGPAGAGAKASSDAGSGAVHQHPESAAAPKATTELVSCGPVAPYSPATNPDIVVLIVDAESRAVRPEGRAGEVWISSPSVAAGYWNRPDLTEAAFKARLAPPAAALERGSGSGDGIAAGSREAASSARADEVVSGTTAASVDEAAGAHTATTSATARARDLQARYASLDFLRTGDIGAVVGGELYICGRMKDLIIVRGRNYFPQDIEASIEANQRVRPGCTAAFQVQMQMTQPGTRANSGSATEPALVAACELRDASLSEPDLRGFAAQLRTAVMRDHGVPLSALVLLKPKGLCKTTSGKVARKWNAKAFADMGSVPGSPWHASKGVVLFTWRAPLDSSGGAEEEDGAEAAEGAGANPGPNDSDPPSSLRAPEGAVAATAAAAGTAAASAAAPPNPAPPRLDGGDRLHATGPELLRLLQQDAGGLLREAGASLDVRASLQDLGFDSLLLTQLTGMLHVEYGFLGLRDEVMFADTTSLQWLVDVAATLRAGLAPELPHGGASHAPPSGAGSDAAAPASTTAGKSSGATPAPPSGPADQLPGAGGGQVAEVGLLTMPRRTNPRQKASWFETNCPCLTFCC